jgi:hypothetical protein
MALVQFWKVDGYFVCGEGAGCAGSGRAFVALAPAHQHLRPVLALEKGRSVPPVGHRAVARGLSLNLFLLLLGLLVV